MFLLIHTIRPVAIGTKLQCEEMLELLIKKFNYPRTQFMIICETEYLNMWSKNV